MASRGRRVSKDKLNPKFGTGLNEEAGISEAILNNARRSGQLNICNRGLTEIPQSVYMINNIEAMPKGTLSFADTESNKWWETAMLTKLSAASNRLRFIGSGIKNLPELTTLDVYDNELEYLPPALCELEKLRYLNVSINKLQELPDHLGNCSQLSQLMCQRNMLKRIPESIGRLETLEYMDFTENQIEELPETLCNLNHLHTLNLRSNKLQHLPNFFHCFPKLTILDISGNRLESIPDSMCELESLQRLDLHQNCLRHCPLLTNCRQLKELFLGENQIVDISEDIFRLQELVILDLHFNRIEKIPAAICSMESLERLDIGNNDLTNLPLEMGRMEKLKALIIDGNPLRTIRRDVINRGTEAIKKSLLNRIALQETKELGDQPMIRQTGDTGVVGSDREDIDPFVVTKTQTFELINKSLKNIGLHIWHAIQEIPLKAILLRKNFLTEMPKEITWFSASLLHLDIGVNKLTRIPDNIDVLQKLQQLELSGNNLSELPESVGRLQNLRHVDLSYNRFKAIPPALFSIRGLEHILMGTNVIDDIDVHSLLKMSRLQTLDLQNNNLHRLDPLLGLCEQITCLKVEGNCFRIPRPALLNKGTEAVLEYLRSRIQE